MHPLFVATGPAFKKNYISKMLNNTDIYILMCTILGLTPAQHNGSFNNIKDLLANDYVLPGSTVTNKDEDFDIILIVNVKPYFKDIATINYFLILVICLLVICFIKSKSQLSVRADPIKKIDGF